MHSSIDTVLVTLVVTACYRIAVYLFVIVIFVVTASNHDADLYSPFDAVLVILVVTEELDFLVRDLVLLVDLDRRVRLQEHVQCRGSYGNNDGALLVDILHVGLIICHQGGWGRVWLLFSEHLVTLPLRIFYICPFQLLGSRHSLCRWIFISYFYMYIMHNYRYSILFLYNDTIKQITFIFIFTKR